MAHRSDDAIREQDFLADLKAAVEDSDHSTKWFSHLVRMEKCIDEGKKDIEARIRQISPSSVLCKFADKAFAVHKNQIGPGEDIKRTDRYRKTIRNVLAFLVLNDVGVGEADFKNCTTTESEDSDSSIRVNSQFGYGTGTIFEEISLDIGLSSTVNLTYMDAIVLRPSCANILSSPNLAQIVANLILKGNFDMDLSFLSLIQHQSSDETMSVGNKIRASLNPSCLLRHHLMDVISIIYLRSDSQLKMNLMTALVRCGVALQFIGKNQNGSQYFNSWGLRNVVFSDTPKRNTDKTSVGESFCDIQWKIVSAIRFGDVSSKSMFLNKIVRDDDHCTFYNRHCLMSHNARRVSNGTVDCFFHNAKSDSTSPFLLCNLRGDANDHPLLLQSLWQISGVVICFIAQHGREIALKALQNFANKESKKLYILFCDEDGFSDKQDVSASERSEMSSRGVAITTLLTDANKPTIGDCVSHFCQFLLDTAPAIPNTSLNSCISDLRGVGLLIEDDMVDHAVRNNVCKIVGHLPDEPNARFRHSLVPLQCSLERDGNFKADSEFQRMDDMFVVRFIRAIQMNREENMYLQYLHELLEEHSRNVYSKLYTHMHEFDTGAAMTDARTSQLVLLVDAQKRVAKELNLTTHAAVRFHDVAYEIGQLHDSLVDIRASGVTTSLAEKELISFGTCTITRGFPLTVVNSISKRGIFPAGWLGEVLSTVVQQSSLDIISCLSLSNIKTTSLLQSLFGIDLPETPGKSAELFAQLIPVDMLDIPFRYFLVLSTSKLSQGDSDKLDQKSMDIVCLTSAISQYIIIVCPGENNSSFELIFKALIDQIINLLAINIHNIHEFQRPHVIAIHQNVSAIDAQRKLCCGIQALVFDLDIYCRNYAQLRGIYGITKIQDILKFDVEDLLFFPDPLIVTKKIPRWNLNYCQKAGELREEILKYARDREKNPNNMPGIVKKLGEVCSMIVSDPPHSELQLSTFLTAPTMVWCELDDTLPNNLKRLVTINSLEVNQKVQGDLYPNITECFKSRIDKAVTLWNAETAFRENTSYNILNVESALELAREYKMGEYNPTGNVFQSILRLFLGMCPPDLHCYLTKAVREFTLDSSEIYLATPSDYFCIKHFGSVFELDDREAARICETLVKYTRAANVIHLENSQNCSYPFLPTLVSDIYTSLLKHIRYYICRFKTIINFNDAFIANIFIAMSAQIARFIETNPLHTRPTFLLSNIQLHMKHSQHPTTEYPLDQLYSAIKVSLINYINQQVTDAVVAQLVQEMKDKEHLLTLLLTDLLAKDDVDLFMMYLADSKSMALKWLNDSKKQIIKKQFLMQTKAKIKEIKDRIVRFCAHEKVENRETLDKKIGLLHTFLQQSFGIFIDTSKTVWLNSHIKTYIQRFLNKFEAIHFEISSLPIGHYTAVPLLVLENLWGCCEVCPCCSETCCLKEGHEDCHVPIMHRPMVLTTMNIDQSTYSDSCGDSNPELLPNSKWQLVQKLDCLTYWPHVLFKHQMSYFPSKIGLPIHWNNISLDDVNLNA